VLEGNAEEKILQSIIPLVFIDDIVRFARQAGEQVISDHAVFQKDYDLGAFDFMGNPA